MTAPAVAARRTGAGLRRYLPYVTSGLQGLLQYRITFLVSGITAAVTAGLLAYLWREVFAARDTVAGFDLAGITTYVVLAQVLALLQNNRVDEGVSAEISRGDIAAVLIRPVSYPVSKFFASLPVSVANAVVVGVPVLGLYTLLLPLAAPTWSGLALFGPALVGSVLIAYAVNMLVGLAGFVSTNVWGLRTIKDSAVALLAGQLVPLAVMPEPMAAVARLLPFHGMVDSPLRLLLGRYSGAGEAVGILAVQLGWAVALLLAVAVVWRLAVRRLEVQGG
ncbi:ABC-2 family transporter protein [Polymorphospora sp. NPDC051019]|uniref:ABC transporter permease n=1 Tax=Polymorphospora sp. NPDC051019 TaxID=3155725 RepID=UPI0034269D02